MRASACRAWCWRNLATSPAGSVSVRRDLGVLSSVITSRTGRTVTIVSNNSGAAIAAYLADHRLTGYIRAVVARDDSDPERMKPDPYRVREAVGLLDADQSTCVLAGDSTADVLAGHLAGVDVIGYANRPGKVQALASVQAAAVTTDLAEITTALRAAPVDALIAELIRSYDRGGAAARRRWPGVSTRAQPWRPARAHAGLHAGGGQIRRLIRQAVTVQSSAIFLGFDCPARGHRV
jgi:Haloacid dehalogenase-like hydrolase